MARVVIDTNGSPVENLLRDHLLGEKQDVLAEIAKAEGAAGQLRARLAFLEALERQARERGLDLHEPASRPGTAEPAA